MSLVTPPPQNDQQLMRQFNQRIKALEHKKSARVGAWTLTTDADGNPVLVRPGEAKTLDGSAAVDPQSISLATRGFITDAEVARVVSGGSTHDLSAATATQVQKDVATNLAQYTADNANALAAQALAQLESGPDGVAYNDSFDRPEANDFGPDYDMTMSSGGNRYGTRGDGTTGHTISLRGANNQEWMFRRLSDLNTSQQRVSATILSKPVKGQNDSLNARLYLSARVDSTLPLSTIDGRMQAIVEVNRCCIGYYLGGGAAFVNLSGWEPMTAGSGDSYDFWCGLGSSGHDRFKFALIRNTLTVCTADDIPENTAVLLDNRQGAVGVRTAVTQFGFVTQTVNAPSLQSINIADRTAAA